MNGVNEIWKPVADYPQYSVSSFGRVRSDNLYSHREPLIMNTYPNKDGHMRVRLCKDGAVKNYFVHRLVAAAFIANPNGLPVVNHKDENPANNHVDNLEWCTVQENTVYNKMPQRRADPLRRAIVQKTLSGAVIKKWDSRASIAAETGFSGGNITSACQGKRKSANGYLWEYAEEWGRSG